MVKVGEETRLSPHFCWKYLKLCEQNNGLGKITILHLIVNVNRNLYRQKDNTYELFIMRKPCCVSSMAGLGWATLRHYWIGNRDNNDVYRARSPNLRLCSFYAAKHTMVADLWHLGHPKSVVTENKARAKEYA